MLKVTTSWDDGDVLDGRLADELDTYKVKGTFYVNRNYRQDRLSVDGIKDLSKRHEIGAHTLTHIDLSKSPVEIQREEIAGSKKWIEAIIGAPIQMFCYPFGHVGAYSEQIVKEAGFKGARTTEYGAIHLGSDPFFMPTTIHIYPFPLRKKDASALYWRKLFQPYFERSAAFKKLGLPFTSFRSFESLACAAFDIAKEKGEVFHLWGHSWEIEKYGMWQELGRVLAYISGRADCQYLTNGDIITRL